MARTYLKVSELPIIAPVFPLDGGILLPHAQLPLNIFEPRYLNMVDDVMAGDRLLTLVQTVGGPAVQPELADVGGIGRITRFSETSDGRYLITLTGVCRTRLTEEIAASGPYRQFRHAYEDFADDLKGDDTKRKNLTLDRKRLIAALRNYLTQRSLELDWDTAKAAPPEALINSLSMALPFDRSAKQLLLEADTVQVRAEALIALLEIDAAPGDGEPPSVQ